MRYLILFDLGQKRYAKKLSSRKAAIDYINFCTQKHDDVIRSIVNEEDNSFRVTFEDNTQAKFRIIKSVDGCSLGYYEVDLYKIFSKIRNRILAEKTIEGNKNREQERSRIIKKSFAKKARMNALGLVLVGIACVLGGFAVMALLLTPNDSVWIYVVYMAVVALGLALTLRGSYQFIWPKKSIEKREKRALDFE
ncbi:MAG: hypothetical protein Q4A96_04815 [Candidatus Saccharibacteria bacterium]|nr:hypothetical protein [Candidatus Saccharibacteria bacterium]